MQTERYVHNHFEFMPKLLHKSSYFHKCKDELLMQLYHGEKMNTIITKKSWVLNLIKNVKCVTCFVISEYVESRVMGDRFSGMFRQFLLKVKFKNSIED